MKLPIKWVLIGGIIGLLMITVSIILVSSYLSSEKVLLGHSQKIMENIADFTALESQHYLDTARDAAELTQLLADSKVVSSEESDVLERYFFEQLVLHSHLAGIYYGNTEGEFIYVMRNHDKNPSEFRTKIISVTNGRRDVKLIWRNRNKALVAMESTPSDPYDPRARPWFIRAMNEKKLIWTDPYIFYTSKKPGLTTASPVLHHDGTIKGVVGVDIEISNISTFLSQLQIGENGLAFILNRNGDVIAFPDYSKILHSEVEQETGNMTVRLRKVTEMDDVLCRTSYASLHRGTENFHLDSPQFSTFTHQDRRYHAMFAPFNDPRCPWTIGIYLPEDDYLGPIKRNRLLNIYTGFGITFFAGLLGLFIARGISRPMSALQKESGSVTQHDFETSFNKNSMIKEIQETSDSFSTMKESLRAFMFENEQLNNGLEKHAADLARTNAALQQEIEIRKKAERNAEQASLAKSVFLANMSHEIRTPLSGILGMTEMIQTRDLPEDLREELSLIHSSATNLSSIINDILDLSKIEAGKITLMPETFNLHEFLRGIIKPFSYLCRDKEIELSLVIDESTPIWVTGDISRLEQITNNLLSNAVKFTEKGYVRLAVSLDKRSGPNLTLRFLVEDTGIGIPKKKQEHLFQRFTQLDNSLSKKFEGTGLGLVISKHLVELMNGSIALTSTEGEGSTFRFTVQLRESCKDEASENNLQSSSCAEDLSAISPLKILLAEDNIINTVYLTKFLTQAGHEVSAVVNGNEVMEALKADSFDLILMDVQMPEMDGLEATRAIRDGIRDRLFSDIPIIALTAYAMKGDRERFLDSGMNDYVTKPVDFKVLASTISRVMKKQSER